MKQNTNRVLDFYNLDMIDYKEAWDLQRNTFEKRKLNEINDSIFLLEHPNTYTLGKVTDKKNLICSEEFKREKNISIYEIDRGGDITYHGPGQIVGYPIINLSDWYQDTHKYLRGLEEVIILTCKDYDLNAGRINGLTGVWIENKKIAAIGIKISNWITMHGFAFNVNTDLSLFSGIIPCGISNKGITSIERETDKNVSIQEVKEKLINYFKLIFNYDKVIYKNLDLTNELEKTKHVHF